MCLKNGCISLNCEGKDNIFLKTWNSFKERNVQNCTVQELSGKLHFSHGSRALWIWFEHSNKTYGMKDAKPQTLTYVALVQYAFYDLHFGTMVQIKSNVDF